MNGKGSPTPLEKAIWIFDWFEIGIRLQKIAKTAKFCIQEDLYRAPDFNRFSFGG